jgi:ABC-type transport system involved in multi-copper enzyme maturation permease subunit
MSKMTKFLLVLSLSCLTAGLIFVTGTVNVGEAVWLYVTFPAGAIFFGLFLIALSLQGPSALFDEEQRMAVAAIAGTQPTDAPKAYCQQVKPDEKKAYALAHSA